MKDRTPSADQPVSRESIEVLAQKLTVWACLAFGLAAFFSVLSLRCLYADGSFQLTETLKAGGFVALAKNRECASYIFQLPVVIAMKLGVTNLHALELLFGVGCFLPWPISLMCCRWLAPRQFWLAMLGCAVGYLNAGFMPVGEYNIAHCFFWPVLFAILFAKPLKPVAAAILVVSAVILLLSYESLLFLGPPLALLAVWRAAREDDKPWGKTVLVLAALLLLSAAGIALDGILHPECPNNLGGFKRGVQSVFFDPTWTIIWSFVWLVVMGCTCLDPQGVSRRFFTVMQGIFAGAILCWALAPILDSDNIAPERQYELQVLQLMVPFALMVLGWCSNLWPHGSKRVVVGSPALVPRCCSRNRSGWFPPPGNGRALWECGAVC